MLGHASATLTLDRCGHLFPAGLDPVVMRLDVAARLAGAYKTCTDGDLALFGVDAFEARDVG